MKHGIQTQKVVAEVVRLKPKARWMFLTLTVKNVYDGEELNKSLEHYKTIEKTISESLSDFEKQVLSKFIEGQSYIQIAEELNSPVKSIDNAIQRIRKKTIKNLGNEMIS